MLRLDRVSRQWGEFAHRTVSFEVAEGEFFVLLGPSGAGKSLLLELIAGFARPDHGRIFVKGRDVTDIAPERRNIGLVYQDLMLFPHMNVRQNIAYGPRARGLDSAIIEKRVAALAEMLHIGEYLDRPATSLSAGQRQRAALARALATEPDVLLLDEPFSSLDPPLQMSLWKELTALHRRTGVTILHVTHDRSEAIALVCEGTHGIHISLDLDFLDPREAPGVGTPVRGGATYREAHLTMETLWDTGRVVSMDLVEVNPVLDRENHTAELAVGLVGSGFGLRIL